MHAYTLCRATKPAESPLTQVRSDCVPQQRRRCRRRYRRRHNLRPLIIDAQWRMMVVVPGKHIILDTFA